MCSIQLQQNTYFHCLEYFSIMTRWYNKISFSENATIICDVPRENDDTNNDNKFYRSSFKNYGFTVKKKSAILSFIENPIFERYMVVTLFSNSLFHKNRCTYKKTLQTNQSEWACPSPYIIFSCSIIIFNWF